MGTTEWLPAPHGRRPPGPRAAQHFMALLVPGDQLVFRGYHRIVNLHAIAQPDRVKAAFDAMEGVR